jgi:hypothetical protein
MKGVTLFSLLESASPEFEARVSWMAGPIDGMGASGAGMICCPALYSLVSRAENDEHKRDAMVLGRNNNAISTA